MSSVGVYQPPVQASVLARFENLRESFQIFGELCTQLGVISQSVAVQIKNKMLHFTHAKPCLDGHITSQLLSFTCSRCS